MSTPQLIGQCFASDSLLGLLHDDYDAFRFEDEVRPRQPVGIAWIPDLSLDIVELRAQDMTMLTYLSIG